MLDALPMLFATKRLPPERVNREFMCVTVVDVPPITTSSVEVAGRRNSSDALYTQLDEPLLAGQFVPLAKHTSWPAT